MLLGQRMTFPSVQKYILHPITGLFFAFGTALFIHHYHLIEFPYAATVSFGLVFISYLFLSKKYDSILSFVFLLVSLFVFYSGVKLPRKDIAVATSLSEEQIKNKLMILASLVKTYHIDHGEWPESLNEAMAESVMVPDYEFYYCAKKACEPDLLKSGLRGLDDKLFVVTAKHKVGERQMWSIDESLKPRQHFFPAPIESQP